MRRRTCLIGWRTLILELLLLEIFACVRSVFLWSWRLLADAALRIPAPAPPAAAQKAQEMKQAEALKASVEQQLGHARELERDRMKALEEANR